MSNLLASFNAGVSGLKSAQASLNTTSHNLANAHTPGYTRQQNIVTDSFYQNSLGVHNNMLQVGTGTVIVETRQIRNTFLDARYRLEFGRQGFYEENQKAAIEVIDMLGELEGEQFKVGVHDLWGAFHELSKDPGNIVYKDEMIAAAELFVDRAQVLSRQLNTYQTSLNAEVIKQVNAVNDLVTKIYDLNKLIRRYEAAGESANDYRDKRNLYLDELSHYINIETNEEKDGFVTIYSEGHCLLDISGPNFLATAYDPTESKQSLNSQLLIPVWENGDAFFMEESLKYSNKLQTDVGSLRGLVVARGCYAANYTDTPVKPEREDFENQQDYEDAMRVFDEELKEYNDYTGASVIMTIQSQIDILMHEVATRVNNMLCPNTEYELPVDVTLPDGTVLAAGTKVQVLDEDKAMLGDDADNTMGTELFSRRGVKRYTEIVVGTTIGEDGEEIPITKKMYNEEIESDLYSLYTVSQLEINPELLQDPSRLPTMFNPNTGADKGYDNDTIRAIAGISAEKIGALDPNSLATYSGFDFYDQLVVELGVQGSVWSGIVDNQELTVTSVDNERLNVMAVSTEEELSDLIKFQRCYDASSRYITTVAEMLEYLIERLG